jgi:hypothetical protein
MNEMRQSRSLQGHEGEDEPPAGKDGLKGVGVGAPEVVGVPQGLEPCAPAAQHVHHLDRAGVVEVTVRPAAEGPDDARRVLLPTRKGLGASSYFESGAFPRTRDDAAFPDMQTNSYY